MSSPSRHQENGEGQGGYPGIIDTLGNAFALLNRRPYLIWLPIAIDFTLWSGLRLPVTDPLGWLGTIGLPGASGIDEGVQRIRTALADTELLGLTGWLMPTLIDEIGAQHVASLGLGSDVVIPETVGRFLMPVALVISLVIGVSYLTTIGRLVNDNPAWGLRFVRDCLSNAVRVVAAGLGVVTLLAFLLLPFVALGVALHFVGLDPTVLLSMVAVTFAIWGGLFFFFTAHSLALGETRPFEALRRSYSVVQRNLLSVIGLLLILMLIRIGTPVALQIFTDTRWSVPFAIVVNAYVATGLVTASMLYFRDRSAESSLSPSAPNAAGTSR